nr:MAG TPA: glycoprotein [Caudoviricetes sp.]
MSLSTDITLYPLCAVALVSFSLIILYYVCCGLSIGKFL